MPIICSVGNCYIYALSKKEIILIFLHVWDRADGYNADYVSFMKHIEISNFLLSWDGDRASSGSRKTQRMNCSRISRCDFSRISRERFFRDLQYKIFPPRWRWDPAKPKGRQTWGSMPQSLLIIYNYGGQDAKLPCLHWFELQMLVMRLMIWPAGANTHDNMIVWNKHPW